MNWNSLDRIWLSQNVDRFRRTFHELAEQNRQKAFHYLNKEKLPFPSLFILMPEIEALNLYENLNSRNIIALQLCAKKLNHHHLAVHLDRLPPQNSHMKHQVFKWMFNTGVRWEGPHDDPYDAVLDALAALLIRTYEDKTVLPAVADLIFKRNRKGLFIHDLVWSFFQAYDPKKVTLIAKYLLSDKQKDVELACRLLHLPLPKETDRDLGKRKLYKNYRAWLSENRPFLYLTGEHFQLTSDPEPLRIDLEAKYLYKKISPKDRKPLQPLTEKEILCLNQFRETSQEEREILSAYSYQIHHRKRSWEKFMQKQLPEQVRIAKSDFEVV